jgi:hypothetical protein
VFSALLLAAGVLLSKSWIGILAIAVALTGLAAALAYAVLPCCSGCTGNAHPNR